MTAIKPSDHGIVVDNIETGMQYAISDKTYDQRIHRKVRDLLPGESRLDYAPRRQQSLASSGGTNPSPETAGDQATDQRMAETDPSGSPQQPQQTEGSSSEGTKDTKERN